MKLEKIVLGAAALSLTMVSCGNKQGTDTTAAPQAYKTIVVNEQDAELQRIFPVTLKGQEDVEIRPRVDGFIKEIYVDEGSVVKAGQVLFKIDSPQTEQAVLTAQAAVKSAEAQVNTATTNVERVKPLAEKGIVSQVQLKTAEDSRNVALAGLAQAKATLQNAIATRSWATVTSPVNGVVGAISYRKGSLVSSSNILTTVANVGSVYAYFSMNEKTLTDFLNTLDGKTQAEKIKNVPALTLTLADGTEYAEKGKLETITGTIDVTTGSANIRAEFPNKNGQLRSGTSGKVVIPRVEQNVFIIPQSATFQLQDRVLVYKVQGDSVVQRTISVLPTPDGKSYAVTNGLEKGERIVSEGVSTLTNGKKIKAE